MNKKYEVQFIFHFNALNYKYSLKIFNQTKKIVNKVISFQFFDNSFKDYQIFLPTKVYIVDKEGYEMKDYTLNLIKGINYYNIYSFNNTCLFECLFYNEKILNIIVNGEETEKYNECSNFKRFSFINLDTNIIKINGTEIDLFKYCPRDLEKENSFHLSFYDIQKKYIVSKCITTINDMNFHNYYKQQNPSLYSFSNEIDKLKNDKSYFQNNISGIASIYAETYKNMKNDTNLNLPKQELNSLLNREEYYDFFYSFSKMKLFYNFFFKKDNTFQSFVKLFKKLEKINNQLKSDELLIYEKITVLLTWTTLFGNLENCKDYLKANLEYIKIDNVEDNSVVDLTMKFLNNFINNINGESPSYFKLVEINSGYGYYNGNKDNSPIFIYDMIDSTDLRKHLQATLPSVISFYDCIDTKNLAFTELTIGGICVNKSKLYEKIEDDIKLNICYPLEKKRKIKNISMKLAERLMHEIFGHSKFQFHPTFCEKKISASPKKCFDNKILKELVGISMMNIKDTINVLANDKRSDSGNYFESSFGKLPGNAIYTFTYLRQIKDIGILLDYPEFFYDKANLEKLQKYVYYKYLYEIENEKEVKYKEATKLGEKDKDEIIIELSDEEEDSKSIEKNSKEKSNENIFENGDFNTELDYLTNIFCSKNISKNSTLIKNEDIKAAIVKNTKDKKKFLGRKRKSFKRNYNSKNKNNRTKKNIMIPGYRESIKTKILELGISEIELKDYKE